MAARFHDIRFYGGFEGKYRQTFVHPVAAQPYWQTADVWFTIFALGCRIYGYPTGWQVGLDRTYNVEITMPTGGTNDAASITLTLVDPGSGGTDVEQIDFTGGSWEISGVAEEVITNTSTGSFPTYGGVEVADGAKETNQVRSERLKPGTTLTATIDAGGLVATGTLAITEENTFAVSYGLSLIAEAQSWGDEANIALTQATYDWDGGEYALSNTFSATTSQGHLASGSTCVAVAPSTGYRTVTTSAVFPPKKWAFYPRVRAMEQAYPGSVNFSVDKNRLDLASEVVAAGDGSLAVSGTQEKYSTGASFWQAFMIFDTVGSAAPRAWTQAGVDQPTSLTIDNWYPFRAWLRNQWIVAQGEPQRDWRTQILETPFTAYSLQHASSYTAEDGASAWTNVSNVTPSNSGGYVVLAVSGGTGSAQRTFALTGRENTINPADDWQSFRYLEIELQADGVSKPFTFGIQGKTWSSTTHGTANTDIVRTFDLQAPHNAATPTDGTDSRWPLNVLPGDYFGIVKAATMTLSALENGVTYKVNRITLVRSTRAKVSHALAFERWAANSVGSDYNRHVTGEVDGKVGLEVAGMTRTLTGFGYSYDYPTIAQCVAAITERPGWTAAVAGSYPDDQHDSGQPLMYCGGKDGGYHTGSAWVDSFDQSATGSLSITACKQFDSMDWYPACGDIQTLTYGEVTPMRLYKAIRAEAWGVVIDNTAHAGASGEDVDITGGTSADETVVSDTLGYFISSPRKEATVEVATGGNSLARQLRNRYRVYGGLGAVGGTDTDGISTDFSRGQRKVRAYRVDGTIRLAFPNTAGWTNYTERDTGIAGKPTEARWELSGKQNLMYLQYKDNSDSIWLLSSANEGADWIMAVTLATDCTQAAMAIGRNHLIYNYFRTSAGALHGVIVNSLGTTVVPEFEVLSSGVDDLDIACAATTGFKGKFQIVIDYYASGALTQITSVDGVVFS